MAPGLTPPPAVQIVLRPSEESQLVRGDSRLQPGRLQAAQDEAVDVIADPAFLVDRRKPGVGYGLKGPVRELLCGEAGLGCFTRRRGPRDRIRPDGARSNPLLQGFDLPFPELAGGRHFDRAFIPHGLNEPALVRVSLDDDGGSRGAAEKALRGRKLQTGHLHLFAVALGASFQENGADSAFEEFAAIRDLAAGRRQEQRGADRDALPEGTSHRGKEAHPFTRSYLLTKFDPNQFPAGMCQRNMESSLFVQYRTFPLLGMGSFCVGRSGTSPEGDGSCR